MIVATALWRRLDAPGHDACRLERFSAGWRIEGTAIFRSDDRPACLAYSVMCDADWRTIRGDVRGWGGARNVEIVVTREAGTWTMNGTVVPGLEDYVDLDLSFTPATNLLQMRRVSLAVGEAADVPVAWLDVESGSLTTLSQRYERRTEDAYWYESPTVGYEALLEVSPNGFVRRYPGLWEMEPVTSPSA